MVTISNYLSDKIKTLSFILIILVLYIHSGFHANEITGMYWNDFIQEYISGKIGRLAVPLFFMISGYLFFFNTDNGIVIIKRKIRSRIKSLVVPYLYGCFYFTVFVFALQFVPGINDHVNGGGLTVLNRPLLLVIKNLFWIGTNSNAPFAFHLWFIRDLIVIVALTPILYYLLGCLKWWLILMLFALTLISIVPSSLFSSLFWFSLGAIFSLTEANIDYKKSLLGILILSLYLSFSLLELISGFIIPEPILKLLIILGIVGIWFSYDFMVSNGFSLKEHQWFSIASGFTFFIYLFHEPTLNIVRKVIVAFLGKNSMGYLISYLLSPFIFVLTMVYIGLLLKRFIPKIYSNLVGGRI